MVIQNNFTDITVHPYQEEQEEQWVIVSKGDREATQIRSLVLSAIGIEHQVDPQAGVILVRIANSERAMFELQVYAEENQNWPRPPNYARPIPRTDNPPTLLMFGSLIIFYTITGSWVADNPWFQTGAINSQAVADGEWWRLVTALTLHADQMHLVGNCVIGGFMVHLLCKMNGYGLGWLALVVSGMAGNLMNIILRNNPHYSVGFSTAIFAAIGIFCGQQLIDRKSSLLRQLILPLGAGAGLLAMLGSEGKQTDFGAHLFGLGCGIICGLLLRLSSLDLQAGNRKFQQFLFLATLVLIIGGWLVARG
jgi:rhomboid protease GluP